MGRLFLYNSSNNNVGNYEILMLSQNYRNRIIDICCRIISTDGKVTLNERIWLNKLIEHNKSAKMIVDSMVDFNNYDSIHCKCQIY